MESGSWGRGLESGVGVGGDWSRGLGSGGVGVRGLGSGGWSRGRWGRN